MARLIPPEITERAKQGFSAPDASWFRGESIEYIKTLLGDPRARIYEYLQPAYVRAKLDEHTLAIPDRPVELQSVRNERAAAAASDRVIEMMAPLLAT